jgi:hypothetical protein
MKADPADRFGISQDAGLDGFALAGGASAEPEGQLSWGAKPAGRKLRLGISQDAGLDGFALAWAA